MNFDDLPSLTPLPREFFSSRDALALAPALLGCLLVRPRDGIVARITETEAYMGQGDPACHANQGRCTPRTRVMFSPGGVYYVYFTYGMYHCLNFVTEPDGEPSAVLLRGLEPTAGAETMKRLRFGDAPMNAYRRKNFLNGPGKLCEGLSLTRAQNGMDLMGDTLFLCDDPADLGLPPPEPAHETIRTSPRIGIDYAEEARDFPWRFELIRED